MKKLIVATTSAIALLGLAACSDNPDTTTTQSVEPEVQETQPMEPADPNAAPTPLEEQPADDGEVRPIE
ncbi:MAG: hypothetical protein RIB55_11525 [Nitratireductor sp.]|jgi:PBP1b-binding outer membrane lipoprotein LpoB